MRRKDRKTDEAAAYAVAEKCGWFALSVTLANGEPYCVPLSMVLRESALYFHCAKCGLKTEALRRDARVCVCCVGEVSPAEGELALEYESAIIRGRADESYRQSGNDGGAPRAGRALYAKQHARFRRGTS